MLDYTYLIICTLYIFGQLSWKHVMWVCLSAPMFWIGKKIVGFFTGMIWLGFKEGIKEQIKVGRPLTPEERQALDVRVRAKAEKRIMKAWEDDEEN